MDGSFTLDIIWLINIIVFYRRVSRGINVKKIFGKLFVFKNEKKKNVFGNNSSTNRCETWKKSTKPVVNLLDNIKLDETFKRWAVSKI